VKRRNIIAAAVLILTVAGLAHAQVAEAIDAITRASNTADLFGLLGLSGIASPFLFWIMSGRRLDRLERIYKEREAQLKEEAGLAKAGEALKEKELVTYRTEVMKVTKGFQWLSVQSEKRLRALEDWNKEHARVSQTRHEQTLREIRRAASESGEARDRLRTEISQNQERMVSALGDRFNDAISRIGRLQVQAIDSLNREVSGILRQIKDALPAINIITQGETKVETGGKPDTKPLLDPTNGTIADGRIDHEGD
jgi:hypothetical protein